MKIALQRTRGVGGGGCGDRFSSPFHFRRRGEKSSSSSSLSLREISEYFTKLKELKMTSYDVGKQQVLSARRNIFGYACGMPGEDNWVKPLEGRKMMKWYWPSKFLLPEVQLSQYFQMQAMRFAPRVHAHASLVKTAQVMGECWKKKKSVEHFLSQIDEETFRENPSIQDLHAVYRTLSKEKVMKFAVDPQVWRDPKFTWKDTPEENKRLDERHSETDPTFSPSSEHLHSTRVRQNQHHRRERATSSVKDSSEKDDEVSVDLQDLIWCKTKHTDAVRSVCLAPPTSPSHTTGPRRFRSGSRGSSGFVRDGSPAADEDMKQPVASTHVISGVRTPQKQDNPQGQLPPSFSLSSSSSRKTRSQSCLLALGEAEDAESSSSSSSSSRMQTPSIVTVQVGLDCKPRKSSMLPSSISDKTSEIGRRKRSLQHKAACQLLKTALDKDEKLANYYHTRHRFFDPLFRRKRLSFLDRFTRERIKADKERQIGTRLYVKHPDQKPLWPDNKGLVTRTWPSPFH